MRRIRRLGPSGSIFTNGKVYDVITKDVGGHVTFRDDMGGLSYATPNNDLWEEVVEEAKTRDRVRVAVKKLHEDAVIPVYAKPGDAGFDLVAVEDVVIEPGETKIIPTGLAFGIPEGYEIQIRPRSGVSSKSKLRVANSPGTVDSGYRGEVGVIVDNIAHKEMSLGFEGNGINLKVVSDRYLHTLNGGYEVDEYYHDEGTIKIRKGDKIAQGVLSEVPAAQFEEVDELDETERGAGGFGSTGVGSEEVQ